MNVNEHVSDMELERYLRRRDRLSQEYAALGSEGPPAELDVQVLERARRALDEDSRSPFWRRANWPRITALAATVVLSFALVVRLAIENEVPVSTAANQSIQSEAVRATAADSAAPTPPPDDVRYGGPEGGSAPRIEMESAAQRAPAAPALPVSADADGERSAPPAVASKEAPSLRYAPMQGPAEEAAQGTAGAETEQAQQVMESAAVSANRLEKHEADSLPPSDEARQRLQRREAALAKRAAEPAQPQFVVQEQKASSSVDPRATRPPGDQVYGSSARGESTALAAERDPQEWFEEIQRLRADGRTEDADRELEKLRKAHPDFEPAQEPKADR